MGLHKFISKIFGNKAQRDLKEISPVVEEIKAIYPEMALYLVIHICPLRYSI